MPIQQRLDDKSICSDCLISEKFLTYSYNTAVNECVNDQLKRDFMVVHQDTQNLLKNIFDIMQSRGWYQLNMANQQQISQISQHLQQERQQMQYQQGGMFNQLQQQQQFQPGYMGPQQQMGGIPQYRPQ
ncbi:MAG: hypothetical protein PWP31_1930 [Clostridia bacterium]|nr:hypothetical protein [Clostridia bacterium]